VRSISHEVEDNRIASPSGLSDWMSRLGTRSGELECGHHSSWGENNDRAFPWTRAGRLNVSASTSNVKNGQAARHIR
jgi:hypothetical protein